MRLARILLFILLLTPANSAHSALIRSRLSHFHPLVTGGNNFGAHWSPDDHELVYENKDPRQKCGNIFRIRATESTPKPVKVTSGPGDFSAASFSPGGKRIIYAGPYPKDLDCPGRDDFSTWHQILSSRPDGTDTIPAEPGAPRAFHSDPVSCKNGSALFTSGRGGKVDLYAATLDPFGTYFNVHPIATGGTFNGQAAFSPDCSQIVWVQKTKNSELWVAGPDGSHPRQLTRLKATSLSPSFTRDGRRIVFSSNTRGGTDEFSIFMIRTDGTGLERISAGAFPSVSGDGKKIAFSLKGEKPDSFDLYMADFNGNDEVNQ